MSLFVFVARVRKTSTITSFEHDGLLVAALVERREPERDALAFEFAVILCADFGILVLVADLKNFRVGVFVVRRQCGLVASARAVFR